MSPFDAAVLATIERDVLRPEVVSSVIERTLDALMPERASQALSALRRELQATDEEVARLADAIATSGPLSGLLAALSTRETRRTELLEAIASTEHLRRVASVDRGVLAIKVREKLADWCGLASRHVEQSRQILRKLLGGPLVCTPIQSEVGVRVRFEADVSLGRLIGGVVSLPTSVASPTGFANMWKRKLAGILRRPPRWSRLRMA